jgi:CheY-like chemotaxis protein
MSGQGASHATGTLISSDMAHPVPADESGRPGLRARDASRHMSVKELNYDLNKVHFLIVEDHEFQRSLLAHLLSELGAGAVYSARDGVEAIRMLRDPTRRVDILLTDLMMPEVEGIELLAMLPTLPFRVSVVLTSTDEAVLAAAGAIAAGYGITVLAEIEKPLTIAKLRSALSELLSAPRS